MFRGDDRALGRLSLILRSVYSPPNDGELFGTKGPLLYMRVHMYMSSWGSQSAQVILPKVAKNQYETHLLRNPPPPAKNVALNFIIRNHLMAIPPPKVLLNALQSFW